MDEGKFPKFPKIPRWDSEVVLTEKIDGENGLVAIKGSNDFWPNGRTWPPRTCMLSNGTEVAAGSRKRWLNPESDHFGFAQWVWDNADELSTMGPGLHYGEWYGKGIQRSYNLPERRFMLFNVAKWADDELRPKCCEVATVIARCQASDLNDMLLMAVETMIGHGSAHVPGYNRPEGIVLYHTNGHNLYKVVFDGDSGKTSDGFVISPVQGKKTVPVRTPEEEVRDAIQNWTNKDWSPPGVQFFQTKLAEATA